MKKFSPKLGWHLVVMTMLACGGVLGYDYNVQRPSDTFRPQWSGARPGVWTMDYEAAAARARAEGKVHIMLVTGSWWCPYCQRFEQNVGLSAAWRNYIAEKGFYLSMLDYPYRFHVDDAQIHKSKYPEMGDGWGFQCWLYDDDYLAENGLTAEDGFRAIQRFYEKQGVLASETAEQFVMRTWDGSAEFTYGKVAYPALIVYLPDGTEAGRFVAQSIYSLPADEAQQYVINKIDTIIAEALKEQCGLCSDPDADECGVSGRFARRYLGWLSKDDGGIESLIEVTAGKASRNGAIKLKASVTLDGRRIKLAGVTSNGCERVSLANGAVSADLKLGERGLSGTLADGDIEYVVTGAYDTFSARPDDVEGHVRAAALRTGTWTLAMRSEPSAHAFAGGFGALTVTVKAKGKAVVRGQLGDGTKVNVSGQLIAGENGVFCLPLVARPYPGKKGGFSCNLWFKDGWFIHVTDIGEWQNTNAGGFSVQWSPVYTALPGRGEIAEDMELLFNDPLTELQGFPLVEDPDADAITAAKGKFKGTEVSDFFARWTVQTGEFSGTMNFYTDRGGRVAKRTKATVYGVIVGGTGYCSVLVRNVGSWAVKISACAACED